MRMRLGRQHMSQCGIAGMMDYWKRGLVESTILFVEPFRLHPLPMGSPSSRLLANHASSLSAASNYTSSSPLLSSPLLFRRTRTDSLPKNHSDDRPQTFQHHPLPAAKPLPYNPKFYACSLRCKRCTPHMAPSVTQGLVKKMRQHPWPTGCL
jgi:hypothetical protein